MIVRTAGTNQARVLRQPGRASRPRAGTVSAERLRSIDEPGALGGAKKTTRPGGRMAPTAARIPGRIPRDAAALARVGRRREAAPTPGRVRHGDARRD